MFIWLSGQSITAAEFIGGQGTEEAPYLVPTPAQLDNVRNHLDAHFKQVAGIDLSDYVGGLVGSNSGPISSSYYDMVTTGQFDTAKGIPQTTVEMMQQDNFEGWIFEKKWSILKNATYPFQLGQNTRMWRILSGRSIVDIPVKLTWCSRRIWTDLIFLGIKI